MLVRDMKVFFAIARSIIWINRITTKCVQLKAVMMLFLYTLHSYHDISLCSFEYICLSNCLVSMYRYLYLSVSRSLRSSKSLTTSASLRTNLIQIYPHLYLSIYISISRSLKILYNQREQVGVQFNINLPFCLSI